MSDRPEDAHRRMANIPDAQPALQGGSLRQDIDVKNYDFAPADIIVFPVIDWHYRFQRPQQISTRLAAHGHRVFYLHTYFLKGTEPLLQTIRNDLPIFDVHLGLPAGKDLFADQLDDDSKRILLAQFDSLQETFRISKAICMIDLPFWAPLVLALREKYGWRLIYNAMDDLSGFSNISSHMLEPETELLEKSDLILATSHLLFEQKVRHNPHCLLLPNGAEFDHFNYEPETIPAEFTGVQKPIIGYYGAINDWFDAELIQNLAIARPQWSFVLIGRVENADVSVLESLQNVFLLDEKPYEILPAYLHRFDTCIIPFKKIPLTEATNPVKLFEYLSAGKPVVATDLDELRYYQDYVRLASSEQEWLEAIEAALTDHAAAQVHRRLSFARQNTWDVRILALQDVILPLSRVQVATSSPLPLILPEENLVSRRLLTRHNDAEYWCCLYEKDDIIYKQASFDLAEREARFLARFESDYFPKVLDVHVEENYSLVTFRKIPGQPLQDAISRGNWSIMELYEFVQHCLNILMALQEKGITHRNICRENILVRDGKPVLLDFGWAVSDEDPYVSPPGLGGYERSPDGHFSDVYSMGRIFTYANRQHAPAFDQVISLMTAKQTTLRIADVTILRALFNTALHAAREIQE
jgi:glycosyltransferase involved in cell wall biosynthesis/tRNA A-37 threonylcarbamoyl transferase component Bud32